MKAQSIRLLDVLLIGPLMVWGGLVSARQNPVPGFILAAMGVGTIAYNGHNWLHLRDGERIPGGFAAGRRPEDFDPEQLRAGTQVELEHTIDPAVAQEIAMDHLTEDPRYYEALREAGL